MPGAEKKAAEADAGRSTSAMSLLLRDKRIYDHNLREHEKSVDNHSYIPDFKSLPYDSNRELDETWKKVTAAVKRPELAASAPASR